VKNTGKTKVFPMATSILVRCWAHAAAEISTGVFSTNMEFSQLKSVRSMALKSAQFVNNQYNVQAENDTFEYHFAAVAQHVVIPVGFYTATELLTIIAEAIRVLMNPTHPGVVITMTVDPNTYKITYVSSLAGANIAIGDFTGAGTLNAFLGNTVDSGVIPGQTVYQFDSFPDLNGLDFAGIDVRSKTSKTILNISPNRGKITNSLGVIPVNVPFGQLQSYTNPDLIGSKVDFSYPEDLSSIEFSVRDTDGDALLDQGRHLMVEFVIWF